MDVEKKGAYDASLSGQLDLEEAPAEDATKDWFSQVQHYAALLESETEPEPPEPKPSLPVPGPTALDAVPRGATSRLHALPQEPDAPAIETKVTLRVPTSGSAGTDKGAFGAKLSPWAWAALSPPVVLVALWCVGLWLRPAPSAPEDLPATAEPDASALHVHRLGLQRLDEFNHDRQENQFLDRDLGEGMGVDVPSPPQPLLPVHPVASVTAGSRAKGVSAREAFERGDFNLAIIDWSEAIQIDPESVAAYHGRGAAYYHRGEFDQAIVDFDEAIHLKPGLSESFNGRGAAYYRRGDLDKAFADFDRALQLNPACATAYFGRALAHDTKRPVDETIADLTEAIRLNPGYSEAFALRGLACYHKGDPEKAVSDYTEAIRLKPGYAAAYHGRRLAYIHKGDFKKASSDYVKAKELGWGLLVP